MFSMVVAMYFWTTYGNEKLSVVPVFVAAENINKGTVIDPNKHFVLKDINIKYLLNNTVNENNMQILSGKSANQYIPKGAQIVVDYFEDSGLVLKDGYVVFKIPNNWIYSMPSTVRRGDSILIYEVDSNLERNLNSTINRTEDNIRTGSILLSGIKLSSKEPILETTMLYVKDGSMREVENVPGRGRLDATSSISSIEIGCTKEEIEVLEKSIVQGMKLLIVYK